MQTKKVRSTAEEIVSKLPIKKLRKLKRADILLLVLSFICALFLWAYIASTITTDFYTKFSKLSIKEPQLANTKAGRFGLQILPDSAEEIQLTNIDCTIYGTRASIGGLSRSDIEVYIDFDSDVTDMIGIQILPLKVRTVNGAQLKADITPSSIPVDMDRKTTKEIPVSETNQHLTWDKEDTVIDENEFIYKPAKITVSGPSRQLEALDHICVNLNEKGELIETQTFESSDFTCMNAAGNPLDSSAFEMYITGLFSVTIPVRYSRTLPVGITINNFPDGFSADAIDSIYKRIRLIVGKDEYCLPDYGDNNLMLTIQTSDPAQKDNLDNQKSYDLQAIQFSDLIPGMLNEGTIPTADGLVFPDQISSVKIKLNDTDLITKTLWIKNSDIQLQFMDNRYNYNLKFPNGNTQITLCGTAKELEQIKEEDITASVNLISTIVSEEGEYTPTITVTLPKTVKGVWALDPPSLAIDITLAT